uniref:Uncharacterized protein n=1 Tax=Branchiostoma floridae TaxID=7739 RepID=C3YJE1_BRAFL|eukprot:XP_002603529.1 hypothetical protein BRAFLDRAFT_79064 [Branchiostoma floridae]
MEVGGWAQGCINTSMELAPWSWLHGGLPHKDFSDCPETCPDSFRQASRRCASLPTIAHAVPTTGDSDLASLRIVTIEKRYSGALQKNVRPGPGHCLNNPEAMFCKAVVLGCAVLLLGCAVLLLGWRKRVLPKSGDAKGHSQEVETTLLLLTEMQDSPGEHPQQFLLDTQQAEGRFKGGPVLELNPLQIAEFVVERYEMAEEKRLFKF